MSTSKAPANQINADDNVSLQIKEIKKKLVDLEDRSRRSNLRFDGISENEEESWEETEKKIKDMVKDKMKILKNVEVERAHRVRRKEIGKARTIVAKFKDYKDKELIMKNTSCLARSKISVYEDFSAETVAVRKSLLPQMKAAREQGKFATIVYNGLIIKDKIPASVDE